MINTQSKPGIIRAIVPAAYGAVDPKEVTHLSGLEFFQGMASGKYPAPPISKTLNFRFVEAEHGRAEGKVMQVGRRVATAEGWLTDSAGKLLAHGTTTCLVFEA